MLKGLGSLVVRALLLSLVSTPAWAGSTIYMDSQTGDYVGGGQQFTLTDSQGTFSVLGKPSSGVVEISFRETSSSTFWSGYFIAPSGAAMTTGNYDGAQYWPGNSPVVPGLTINNNGRSCNPSSARFVVRDVEVDNNGNVTSFAADFQQQCPNSTGALLGAIRYNSSIPYPISAPTADAGVNQIVQEGATVQLDGSLSMPGDSSITSYQWAQLSGTSVALSDPTVASPTFTAPASEPSGGEDLVFQLTVTNSDTSDNSSNATVKVHVANPADPETLLYMVSDTGDYIGQGQTYNITPQQALFASSTDKQNAVIIAVNGGSQSSWGLDFAPPSGQTLQAGTSYEMAQRYVGLASNSPGLSVTGDGRGCNMITGRFVVLDIQTDGSGNITAFAADFEQHCENGAAALRGKIRYKSGASLDAPWADAGTAQLVTQGVDVTLSAAGSDAGGSGATVTNYQWTQLSGPTVSLSDPTAASPTFAAPSVSAGGADLVFQLTITSSDGLTSTSTVTVHVANPSDPVTELMIESDPADYAGRGQNVLLNPLSSSFTVSKITPSTYNGGGVNIRVNSELDAWTVVFMMPVGQSLHTGTFNATQGYPGGNSSGISMGAYYAGYDCGSLGQFTILDLQTDSSGNITSLAADFWQTCDRGKSLLHGKIRYNSSISIYDPIADAGQYQWVQAGSIATLTGAATDPGGQGVTVTSYQWTQLSGPSVTLSDATAEAPTFTAPSVPLGGSDLTFQLTVANSLGLSATSAPVTVHVGNSSDPAPFTALYAVSDPGDDVGQGQTYNIDSSQATFTLSQTGDNLVEVDLSVDNWDIQFAAPSGQALQAGVTYDLAQRYPFQGPISPGMSVTGPGYGCNAIAGRFAVLDVRYDRYGNIASLAVDFDEYCDGNTAGLHGRLRYNSGIADSAPFADAGSAQSVLQGATVALDGSRSDAGSGETMASYQWTQLSGVNATLSDATAATPTFTAPVVPLGGSDLVFQLTVTNAEGRSGSDDVKIHVANPADPVTLLYTQSDAGDQVGEGITQTISPFIAQFVTSTLSGGSALNGVQISVSGGYANSWMLDFQPPQGQTLQVGGNYDMAQRYPFQSPIAPGLSVTGNYSGCNTLTGRFEILDIQTDGTGKLTSFAADFVQYCDGNTAGLHGKIRYNSTVPLTQPVSDPGSTQAVIQGATVTLNGSQSDSGDASTTISSYQWTQVSGPTVTLTDPTGATASFTAPNVPAGGATLVFQLTVTNSLGESTTEDVTVEVANPSDPATGLYLQSKAGGTAGGPLLAKYSPLDGAFTATTNTSQGVLDVVFNGGSNGSLNMLFRGPGGQPLQVGVYNVVGYLYPLSTTAPGFDAYGDQAGCQTVDSGDFDVLQVAYDGSGNVTQFAADFTFYCDGAIYALHGKVRYKSTVPLLSPTADTGRYLYSYTGLPVQLDGSASTPGKGSLTSYRWTQVVNPGDPTVTLSDPTAATPTFVAPAVPAGGRMLSFMLTVTNSAAQSDSATTQVTVGNEADSKTLFYYKSDPGDPLGKGTSALVTSHDAGFDNNFWGTDHVYLSVSGFDSVFNGFDGLSFNGPAGKPITPGTYLSAGAPTIPYVHPFMSLQTSNGDCYAEGVFIVHEATFNTEGGLETAAVDFVGHCPGSTGVMRGVLRYNSTVPIDFEKPIAYAGPDQTVNTPSTVTLDGYGSYMGVDGVYSYQWQELSGPRVALSNPDSLQPSFAVTQSMLLGNGTTFTFQLTVKSSTGQSSSSDVTVRAALPTTNLFYIQSYYGDPIGGGGFVRLTPSDGAITAGTLGRTGASVTLLGGSGWTLDFAAPVGQKLQVGTYSNAVLYRGIATKLPELYVAPKTGLCKTVRGDFTVREITYGRNGVPVVLAVDFDQSCNGKPGLHGEIRYHSTLP